jgi:CheY-like chemotaxis protein
MKILVIDDDHLVRFTLSKLLRRAGYEVTTAADGNGGMTVFCTEHPDVVITDMIMPKPGGIETIIKIKRTRPEVTVIAISGGARIGNMDILHAAGRFGADAALAKPVEMEELLRRLGHPDPFFAERGRPR